MTAYETTTSHLIQPELGTCALIQDLLPMYLEAEVTPTSRELISEHLSRCERCAGFLAGARSVREQLRRDSALRDDSVERDHAARQALITGQRRMMALALGVFGFLFLSLAATAVALNLFRAPVASMAAPIPIMNDLPAAWPDPQIVDPEQHRREMEAAGMPVWDPQPGMIQPAVPPSMPTPTLVPTPSADPAPRP
jgi:anti-sigma factor RsiW